MPLLHAMEDATPSHCDGIHHHEKDSSTHHSMNNCIEIIKKIQKNPSFDATILHDLALVPPFEKYFDTPPELYKIPNSTNYHITDPPDTGRNLTGIVKIIS